MTGTSDCTAVGGCSALPYLNENKIYIFPPNSNQWNHFHNTSITFQTALFIERNILNIQPVDCAGTNGLCNSTATISGPAIICTTGQYQLNNPPNGITITWEMQNGNLKIDNGQGTPVVNVSKVNTGSEIVKVTLTNTCGVSLVLTKQVTVGPPIIAGWYNSPTNPSQPLNPSSRLNQAYNDACFGQYINTNMQISAGATVVWQYNGQPGIVSWNQQGNNLHFYFLSTDTTLVAFFSVTATNTCGFTSWNYRFRQVNAGCSGGPLLLSVSPNPSNNTTVVTLADKADKTKKKDMQEIRIIDKLGNIKQAIKLGRHIQTAIVNVTNLPIDVYTILAFDGRVWTAAKFNKN